MWFELKLADRVHMLARVGSRFAFFLPPIWADVGSGRGGQVCRSCKTFG